MGRAKCLHGNRRRTVRPPIRHDVRWNLNADVQRTIGGVLIRRRKTIRVPVAKYRRIRLWTRIMWCLSVLLSLSLFWLFHSCGECSDSTLALISSKKPLQARAGTDGTVSKLFVNGKTIPILTPATSCPTQEPLDTTIPPPDDGYAPRILQQSDRDTSKIKVLK